MVTINDETIERLRDLYRNHMRPSGLLRQILSLSPDCKCHKLDLIANIRAVFSLSLNEASSICGWEADGTGELSDEKLDRYLSDAIDRHRSSWDTAAASH
jgi:hypothetical protein